MLWTKEGKCALVSCDRDLCMQYLEEYERVMAAVCAIVRPGARDQADRGEARGKFRAHGGLREHSDKLPLTCTSHVKYYY